MADGRADGFGGGAGAVFGALAVLALKLGDLLKLAEDFGFFGFGGVVGVEDGFKFFFFAIEAGSLYASRVARGCRVLATRHARRTTDQASAGKAPGANVHSQVRGQFGSFSTRRSSRNCRLL